MTNLRCIEAIGQPMLMLKHAGIQPSEKARKLIIIEVIHIIIYGILIHNIILAIKTRNTKLFNWITNVTLQITNYYSKAFVLIFYKKYFFAVLEDLKSEEFNKHSEKLNENIQHVNKITKILIKYFILSMTLFLTIFCVLPFFTNGLMAIPPSFDTGRFDVIYKIVHFFLTIYMAYTCCGLDILYMTLLGLCAAQMNILHGKLSKVVEDAKTESLRNEIDVVYDSPLTQNILKQCVLLHDKINKLVEKISGILSLPFFVQYLTGCLMICYSILQLTIWGETNSMRIIGIYCYLCITFTQMAAYHWFGNEIIFKSNKIIESCYMSNWYELDLNSQKIMLLLMERAKRPLIIKVYKFIFISLETLGVIVRSSYSIFALIKARYNPNA